MIQPDTFIREVSLENVREILSEWYDPESCHYITLNATDSGSALTIDWIFSKYGEKNAIYVFRTEEVPYDATLPSIADIVESAWISEWDLADMFDLQIENAKRGMFLEPEAPQAPLRKENYRGK